MHLRLVLSLNLVTLIHVLSKEASIIKSRVEALEQWVRDNPSAAAGLILDLTLKVEQLSERIDKLESQLNKNSRNSSKPPSSDGFNRDKPKPKSLRKKTGRKPGGQAGREGKTLHLSDSPDEVVEHKLTHCPITGQELSDTDIINVIKRQVFELPEPGLKITEHRIYQYINSLGQQVESVSCPDNITAPVQYGPRFEAWLVYLSDFQLLPLNRIIHMCVDLYGYRISPDTISKARKSCYEHLEGFEQQLKKLLSASSLLHADETGVRINGKLEWLHCLSNPSYTLLNVHDSRGMSAIEDMAVLPDFRGVLVHDCWHSYFKLDCQHALCNAHLLRELIFHKEHSKQAWAQEMEELLRHACHEPSAFSFESWQSKYESIIEKGLAENPLPEIKRSKGKRGRQAKPAVVNLLERFKNHSESVLRFIQNQVVPFTNNQAERDIRMVKVQQKISGTFRTWKGAEIFARNRSYISTAIKQGIGVFKALNAALIGNAYFV